MKPVPSAELRAAIRVDGAYSPAATTTVVTLPCGHQRAFDWPASFGCEQCTWRAIAADPPQHVETPFPNPPPYDPAAPKWHQHQQRLPWCAVCRKTIPSVQVIRLGNGGADADRLFVVTCHGETEQTTLTAAEVKAMQGYGQAFAR